MFNFLKSKSGNVESGNTGASPMRSPKPKLMHRLLGSPACLNPAPPEAPPTVNEEISPLSGPGTVSNGAEQSASGLPAPAKVSPKRSRDEDEEQAVEQNAASPARLAASPAKKAPRLSNSPRRQLRGCSGAAQQSPMSERTPPGISAVMKEIRRDKIKKKRIWDTYYPSASSRQPCPACGHMINTADYNFEIQQMIPRGFGADEVGEEWNMFPLCSNVPEGGELEQDGGGWGCSELLEREQCVAVEELEDADTSPAEGQEGEDSASPNALDWLVANYPHRVHEILMRLQRAHGEAFGLPAGEALCLRFARDLYQLGRSQNPELEPTRCDEWRRRGVGFRSDILDLAECLKGSTDAEMLRRVELKDTLTPKKMHAHRTAARTPLSVKLASPAAANRDEITISQPKNLSVSFNETVEDTARASRAGGPKTLLSPKLNASVRDENSLPSSESVAEEFF